MRKARIKGRYQEYCTYHGISAPIKPEDIVEVGEFLPLSYRHVVHHNGVDHLVPKEYLEFLDNEPDKGV